MTREEAQDAANRGKLCVADLPGGVFVCWVDTVVVHRGQTLACVRTTRGKKTRVPLDRLDLSKGEIGL